MSPEINRSISNISIMYIILPCIFLLIFLKHLILVNIFTPLSILLYYALYHIMLVSMTHKSAQTSRSQ